MKKFLLILSTWALTTFASVYEVKPESGKVGFSITKFKINGDVKGTFKEFMGKYNFDKKNMTLSDLDVKVVLKSIDTGDKDRDDHLRTEPTFFDVPKFPEMKFSTEAKKTFKLKAKKATSIKGNLTIKDVTKEVELFVTYLGDKDGVPQFTATTNINRNDFGVSYNKEYNGEVVEHLKAKFANKVIDDEVRIEISLNN